MRADFDVPVSRGAIDESFRIERQKACIQWLVERDARVVIGAHISAVPSFESIRGQLEEILGFRFGSAVTLLENLRNDPGEEGNTESYAQRLVDGCDLYVNNAFAVCHRAHASVVSVPKLLPSYAGPLVVEEVRHLSVALNTPVQGTVVFMGGAKASTKIPVIKHLIARADHIAVGGVIANDILKARGGDVGSSRVDDDADALLSGLDLADARLVVPVDHTREGDAIMDIGPASAQVYASFAREAKLIIWNGPMGKFEDELWMTGTRIVAEAIAQSDAQTIIGGGDTIAAVHACGIGLDQFDFVSTGGGAMLAFLAGEALPGLAALE